MSRTDQYRGLLVLAATLALAACDDDTGTSPIPIDSDGETESTGDDSTTASPSTTTITTSGTTEGDTTDGDTEGDTTDGDTEGDTTDGDTEGDTTDGDTEGDTTDGDTDGGECGDGVVDRGEACDDEGESATCNDDCTEAMCGDGVVNATAGETCDDEGESATCNADCTDAMCGDGVVNATAGEECDGRANCGDDCMLLGPPVSCLQVLELDATAADGTYEIDPDMDGDTETVYCDMTTDGGGWTLVSSTRSTPVNDEAMDYSDELQTINPAAATTGVWDGMRPVMGTTANVRFTCMQDPDGTAFDVDLSFYNVPWYDEFSTGTDADSCFSENQGAGAEDPPPARRDNIADMFRPQGDQWNTGFLEGEDTCAATDDFTIDFDDRGMDGNQSDGTDWGEDDSTRKCGDSGIADGAWHVWVREQTPTNCGNGVIDADESCDEGGATDTCTDMCEAIICGDGVVAGGEDCDDSGESATCNADCTTAMCGDEVVNTTAGEECDEGVATATCTDTCTVPVCGDEVVDVGEDCDDGGDSATCDEDCTDAMCGDGYVNSEAGEDCDGELNCGDDCTITDPPVSCLAQLNADPASVDGVYLIDPNDDGNAFAVYCDMTTDGGGWTLVSSTTDPVNDEAMDYAAELQTLNPEGATTGVWDGMRPLAPTTSDVRFTCMLDPDTEVFDVDLSFYNVIWYDEFTTGTDTDSCFSENNGAGADDPPPARRDNVAEISLPEGDQWNSGFLEGEDSCADAGDFTIDFDDRGMDGVNTDGTDWGEDDFSHECGASGVSGAWHIWFREVAPTL